MMFSGGFSCWKGIKTPGTSEDINPKAAPQNLRVHLEAEAGWESQLGSDQPLVELVRADHRCFLLQFICS